LRINNIVANSRKKFDDIGINVDTHISHTVKQVN